MEATSLKNVYIGTYKSDVDSLKNNVLTNADIASNMSNINGKKILSADIGQNLWWRLSSGRIRFAWANNLAALTLYVDNNLIGSINTTK